jgi:ribosomal protein S18 acetylase RimI-like enzyme
MSSSSASGQVARSAVHEGRGWIVRQHTHGSSTPMESVITRSFAEPDRADVVALLREYEAGLGVSLCFQGFAAEVDGLPGAYAPPRGQMLLARDARDGKLIGMVALRPVRGIPELCEMKRLYVRASVRGHGLGRRLAVAAMGEARELGYRRMCLDTLPSMIEARELYRSLGFNETGASRSEPTVLLFERELGPA